MLIDTSSPCKIHDWENDEMFESGAVVMLTNDNPEKRLNEEVRQFCNNCGDVRYVTKEVAALWSRE